MGCKILLLSLLLLSPAWAARPNIVPVGGKSSKLGAITSPRDFEAQAFESRAAEPRGVKAGGAAGAATVPRSYTPAAGNGTNTTLPACKAIQYAFPAGTGGNATRAAAVKEAYTYAFDAYVEYAW